MTKLVKALAVALAFSGAIAVFAVTGTEPALADARLKLAAEQAQPALIETLRDMVLIESDSSNVAGLAKMAALLEGRLRALGFTAERRKLSKGVDADIVVGTLQGTGSRKLMLIAHMDTVFPAGTLEKQPYRIDGNRIYGPGIADDKGGLALILHAPKILNDNGWRDFAKITVVFNPDEEVGSVGSGDLIAELADQHDVVLSCEPTLANANHPLLLGTSGTGTAALEIKGRASHAGLAAAQGRNALLELAHQLLQTRDLAKGIPGTQLNWTLAQAGTVRNQIPDLATATGDARTTTGDGFARLEAAIRDKLATGKLVAGVDASFRIDTIQPPFVGGAASRELAKRAQAIYAEIDRRLDIIDVAPGAATDAGYAARGGKAAVVESFGLAGFGFHARDEYIDVSSIMPRLYLMTRLLMELGKSER